MEKKQLATWTELTATAVQKDLPELSPANNKCHMKCKKKGLCSTTIIPNIKYHKANVKAEIEKIETEQDINLTQAVETQNQFFCNIRLKNRKDDTIYVDVTGKFPI